MGESGFQFQPGPQAPGCSCHSTKNGIGWKLLTFLLHTVERQETGPCIPWQTLWMAALCHTLSLTSQQASVCAHVCVHTHAHVHLWNMHNKVGKYRFNHNWLQRLNRVTKIAASLYFKFQKPSSERKLAQLNIKKYSKVTKAKPSWDIITSEYTER